MQEVSLSHKAYLKKQVQHRRMIRFLRIFLFFLLIILWEISADCGWINAFIFSSPSRIWYTICEMIKDGSLLAHTGITLLETLLSFFFTIVIGLAAAVILWWNHSVSEVLEPYFVLLNSLPKSALAPLLIVWLGINYRTIIVSGISVAVFGMILNLYSGFQEMDPEMIKLIYTLGGTKKDVLRRIILPGTIPLFISILKVNIGLCLVGVIIGEFVGSRKGLGYLIIYGSQTFQLNLVITGIVILCLISLLLYLSLNLWEKHVLKSSCC